MLRTYKQAIVLIHNPTNAESSIAYEIRRSTAEYILVYLPSVRISLNGENRSVMFADGNALTMIF